MAKIHFSNILIPHITEKNRIKTDVMSDKVSFSYFCFEKSDKQKMVMLFGKSPGYCGKNVALLWYARRQKNNGGNQNEQKVNTGKE